VAKEGPKRRPAKAGGKGSGKVARLPTGRHRPPPPEAPEDVAVLLGDRGLQRLVAIWPRAAALDDPRGAVSEMLDISGRQAEKLVRRGELLGLIGPAGHVHQFAAQFIRSSIMDAIGG